MRNRVLARIAFLVSILSWLMAVFSGVSLLFSNLKEIDPEVSEFIPRLMLDFFVISLYFYYSYKIEKSEDNGFTHLLWRVFIFGLFSVIASLSLRLLDFLLGTTQLTTNIFYVDIKYFINLGLLLSFMVVAFLSWKTLILYQKSKWNMGMWMLFEFLLFLTLFVNNVLIDFPVLFYWVLSISMVLIIAVISTNLKWVAFLSYKQKWTSLLLLILSILYFLYFYYTVNIFPREVQSIVKGSVSRSSAFVYFGEDVFSIYLLLFITIYSIFSFLVVLFNLPTSSVFEQKLEDVVNFQRLSQSTHTEQTEESVYKILMESAISSSHANAAWVEILDENNEPTFHYYKISISEVDKIYNHLRNLKVLGVFEENIDRTKNLSQHLSSIKGIRYRSIITFSLVVKGKQVGILAILHELPQGFNKETLQVVAALAIQAGIAIENFRMIKETLQNERYKEELKIAKAVQKKLLPDYLVNSKDFEISAFSESADEVGGDYYDSIQINENQIGLIIADVSGKGTSAAFYMSQMKGIFHSLSQLAIMPNEFMNMANRALRNSLDRGFFVAASYFVFFTNEKKIHYTRAGHSPILIFKAKTEEAFYLEDSGMALGMVGAAEYGQWSETNYFDYEKGDIMVLFTDGISEAKSPKGIEYGLSSLKLSLLEVVHMNTKDILEHLISKLFAFTKTEEIDDDFTLLIVKFK